MSPKSMLLIGAAAVVILAVLASLGYFNRLVGGGDVAHPPCEQLPDKTEVAEAFAEHTSLVNRLTAVGDGVEVIVGQPCADPNKALISVRVATAKEEASAREILGSSDGFGVPAIVERR